MTLCEQEAKKMRLHIGIHNGYKRIEQDGERRLIGSRRFDDAMRPLPDYGPEIQAAGAAFQHGGQA